MSRGMGRGGGFAGRGPGIFCGRGIGSIFTRPLPMLFAGGVAGYFLSKNNKAKTESKTEPEDKKEVVTESENV